MDAMRATSMEPTYFSAYRSLELTRDAEGVQRSAVPSLVI